MTELQLYKFINENDIECNIFKDDRTGEITKVYAFIPIWELQDFVDLFEDSLMLVDVDNKLECILRKDFLCIEMTQVCEYFQIEPEEIFKQK